MKKIWGFTDVAWNDMLADLNDQDVKSRTRSASVGTGLQVVKRVVYCQNTSLLDRNKKKCWNLKEYGEKEQKQNYYQL